MSIRYKNLPHLFPAPESLYSFWGDIQPYLPKRWRHLCLLSDATLGAFTSIINTKKIGSNAIFINDPSEEIIKLLRRIKSLEYQDIALNIQALAEVNSEYLLKYIRTIEIYQEGPLSAKEAAMMMFAWLFTKRKWIHYDNMNRSRGIVLRKEDLIDLSNNELLLNIEYYLEVLHNALLKTQLSVSLASEFMRENHFDKQDFIIFDPNPLYINNTDPSLYKIRNSASYMFHHNRMQKIGTIADQIIPIIESGARFLIIIRSSLLIKRTIAKILEPFSKLLLLADEITVNTHHIVTYNADGTQGIGHEEYIRSPCTYLILRNYK